MHSRIPANPPHKERAIPPTDESRGHPDAVLGDCPWPSGIPGLIRSHIRHERRDAAEHRQRILEVAQRLFAEHGVDAVSMHQIARAAGIGQGTLYRRYAHKGELCMDLLHERYERFMEEVAAQLAAKATVPALERLDGLLTKIVALLEEHGAMLGPVAGTDMRDVQCSEFDITRYIPYQRSPWYLWLHELFAGLLIEAMRRGELPPLDVPYTVDSILAALHPMLYRFQRQERGFSSERILQGLRHIYIDGLKAPSATLEIADAKTTA
jgi:AcrR family transcriptional regulator